MKFCSLNLLLLMLLALPLTHAQANCVTRWEAIDTFYNGGNSPLSKEYTVTSSATTSKEKSTSTAFTNETSTASSNEHGWKVEASGGFPPFFSGGGGGHGTYRNEHTERKSDTTTISSTEIESITKGETMTLRFDIPPSKTGVVWQQTKYCGRDIYKTKQGQVEVMDNYDFYSCKDPTDKLTKLHDFNNPGKSEVDRTYEFKVGVYHSKENGVIDSKFPTDRAHWLEGIFKQKLGQSATTGYDWLEVHPNTFNRLSDRNEKVVVPARHNATIYQVIGQCGDFQIYMHPVVIFKNEFDYGSCSVGIDAWLVIANCSNALATEITCTYTNNIGLKHAKEDVKDTKFLDYGGFLVEKFRKIGVSRETGYDWSNVEMRAFDRYSPVTSNEVPYTVPPGGSVKVIQVVGRCGDYMVYMKQFDYKVTDGHDMETCYNPVEEMRVIDAADNLNGSVQQTKHVAYHVGVLHRTERGVNQKFYSFAKHLEQAMRRQGKSNITNYNWQTASETIFARAAETPKQQSFDVPVGKMLTVKQLVAVCGDFVIRTSHIDPIFEENLDLACDNPQDKWELVTELSNPFNAAQTLSFQPKATGVSHVTEKHVNQAFYAYALHLQTKFARKLKISNETRIDWEKAPISYFERASKESSPSQSFNVAPFQNVKVMQAVGYCNNYYIHTPIIDYKVRYQKHLEGTDCTAPRDRWVAVGSCSNVEGDVKDIQCPYQYRSGVVHKKEVAVGEMFQGHAWFLQNRFSSSLANSSDTGKDWTRMASEVFFRAGEPIAKEITASPGTISVKFQLVGFCGDYEIHTAIFNDSVITSHDTFGCEKPFDRWVVRQTCDGRYDVAEKSCNFQQSIGVLNGEERIAGEKFNNVAFFLRQKFEAVLKKSNTTQFDWSQAPTDIWERKNDNAKVQQTLQVPAGHKATIYQLEGVCGNYIVAVPEFKTELVNKHNYSACTKGTDEWQQIAVLGSFKSVNQQGQAHYRRGLTHVNEQAPNEEFYTSGNFLRQRFSGISKTTDFNWDTASTVFFERARDEKTQQYTVPDRQQMRVFQAVGVCGDFRVFIDIFKTELVDKFDRMSCTKAHDRWVTMQNCDNLGDQTFDCIHRAKSGVFHQSEAVIGEFFEIYAGYLKEIFDKNLGKSKETGFDWSESPPSLWERSTNNGDEKKLSVSPNHIGTIRQVVGYCGDYIIYSNTFDLTAIPKHNYSVCDEPEDQWVEAMSCDNLQGITETTCTAQLKRGVTHAREKVPGEQFYVNAWFLHNIFRKQKGAVGKVTGIDWSTMSREIYERASDSQLKSSVTFAVPAKHKLTIHQAVAYCGDFVVYTLRTKQNLTNNHDFQSCQRIEESWRLLSYCDNSKNSAETTCSYSMKVGVNHVKEQVTNEMFGSQVFFLKEYFMKTLKPDDNLFNWTTLSDDTWRRSTDSAERSQVPAFHILEIRQLEARCGDYVVHAPKTRQILMNENLLETCTAPTDRLEQIASCDNSASMELQQCRVSSVEGVFHVSENAPRQYFYDFAPKIRALFNAVSNVTGFDWPKASENFFRRGTNSDSRMFNVPAHMRLEVDQVVGYCGYYRVFTNDLRVRLINKYDQTSCVVAKDRWVPVMTCYMNAAAESCSHNLRTGVHHRREQHLQKEFFGDFAGPILRETFAKTLGFSATTGFDWQNVDASIFQRAAAVTDGMSVSAQPMPNHRTVIYQAVGYCGDFEIHTPHRKVISDRISSGNYTICEKTADRWEVVAECDNKESAIDFMCSYQLKSGTYHRTEIAPKAEFYDYAGQELIAKFIRDIGVSPITNFNWSTISSSAWERAGVSTTNNVNVLARHYLKVEQVVGYCGDYLIYTANVRSNVTSRENIAACENASDEWQTIGDEDNTANKDALSYSYRIKSGAMNVKEQFDRDIFFENAGFLMPIFRKTLATSPITGFDWAHMPSELIERAPKESTESVPVTVPAYHHLIVEQVVGVCGDYRIFTKKFRTTLKNRHNLDSCEKADDEWKTVETCDNSDNEYSDISCNYGSISGVVNVLEDAPNQEFLTYAGFLKPKFREIRSYSNNTDFKWGDTIDDLYNRAGQKDKSWQLSVPPAHKLIIEQVVGKCGNYLIYTDAIRHRLINAHGHYACSDPKERHVLIHSPKALPNSELTYTFAINPIGVSHLREAKPGNVFYRYVPQLRDIFAAKIGFSENASFDWTNAPSIMWERAEQSNRIQQTINIPPDHKLYIYQLIGECNDYVVTTPNVYYLLKNSYDEEGCMEAEERKILIRSCDNRNINMPLHCPYQITSGIVNVNETAAGSRFGEYTPFLVAKFSNITRLAPDESKLAFPWSSLIHNSTLVRQKSSDSTTTYQEIPPSTRFYLYQTIGVCGDYTFYTPHVSSSSESIFEVELLDDLISAASRNNVEMMKRIIDGRGNRHGEENSRRRLVNEKRTTDWRTALIEAACKGQSSAVKFLIEKLAEINAKDKNQTTALICAAKHGHADVVRRLLTSSPDENIQDINGMTALMHAASLGFTDIVRQLVRYGAAVNVQSNENFGKDTALILAARHGRSGAVRRLLNHNSISIDQINSEKRTALMEAAYNCHTIIVSMLVRAGAILDSLDSYGRTALMLAAQMGDQNSVEIMLKANADPNIENQEGTSALKLSADNSFTELCQALIKYKAAYQPLLELVVKQSNNVILEELVKAGAKLEKKDQEFGETPLLSAARRSNVEGVRLLLDAGADMSPLNLQGQTVLHVAAASGSYETVQLLLLRGAYRMLTIKDLTGSSPLLVAAKNGQSAIVELMVWAGANPRHDVDYNGNTALIHAAALGDISMANYLLNLPETKRINITAVNSDQHSALYVAALKRNVGVTEYLIKKDSPVNTAIKAINRGDEEVVVTLALANATLTDKIDTSDNNLLILSAFKNLSRAAESLVKLYGNHGNHQNQNGNSALYLACLKGHVEVLKVLLDSQYINPEQRNRNGETPLLTACRYGHLNIVEMLIERGADLTAQDNDGATPLRMAILYGHRIIVERLLMARPSDLELKDGQGNTPFHLAATMGYVDIVKYLIDKKADVTSRNVLNLTGAVDAANHNAIRTIELLMKSESDYFELLRESALLNQPRALRTLKFMGINMNHQFDGGNTVLHLAAQANLLESVTFLASLLPQHIDVNLLNNDGKTAVVIAANLNHYTLIEPLKAANLDLLDSNGQSALHYAVEKGYVDTVRKLAEHGANMNVANKRGNSALLETVISRNIVMLRELIALNVDVNAHDPRGDTALHIAVKARLCEGSESIVKLLFDAGADRSLRNNENLTAAQISASSGATACLLILKHN